MGEKHTRHHHASRSASIQHMYLSRRGFVKAVGYLGIVAAGAYVASQGRRIAINMLGESSSTLDPVGRQIEGGEILEDLPSLASSIGEMIENQGDPFDPTILKSLVYHVQVGNNVPHQKAKERAGNIFITKDSDPVSPSCLAACTDHTKYGLSIQINEREKEYFYNTYDPVTARLFMLRDVIHEASHLSVKGVEVTTDPMPAGPLGVYLPDGSWWGFTFNRMGYNGNAPDVINYLETGVTQDPQATLYITPIEEFFADWSARLFCGKLLDNGLDNVPIAVDLYRNAILSGYEFLKQTLADMSFSGLDSWSDFWGDAFSFESFARFHCENDPMGFYKKIGEKMFEKNRKYTGDTSNLSGADTIALGIVSVSAFLHNATYTRAEENIRPIFTKILANTITSDFLIQIAQEIETFRENLKSSG